MTTDIKALRAKFEAWATAAYRLSFDDDTPLKRCHWGSALNPKPAGSVILRM